MAIILSLVVSAMKREGERNVLHMTEGNPVRLLLTFGIPLFLSNLLQQFYNLADTAIAGHILGDVAISEIGATSALYGLIINFAFGLNNGFALSVSRNFGAGNREELKKAVCWMSLLSLALAFILSASFLLFRHHLLRALQVPSDILPGALEYLTIILAGIPFTMIYNYESSLMQSVGNSVTPLLLLSFSTVLNIFLDIFFMGQLDMGVQGAAIATVFSQAVAVIIGLLYIVRHYAWLSFGRDEFRAGFTFVRKMLAQGFSMALMSAIYNLGSVILQGSINALGQVYIAAHVGSRRIAEFFFTPGVALGSAVATFTSQNYGAHRNERIKAGIGSAILIYFIWWIFAMILTFTVVEDVLAVITGSDNPDVIGWAARYLKISVPLIPPMSVLVILRNALQGMTHPILPLTCSALELSGKALFAIFIVPVYGYAAVCICEPSTWIICFVVITLGALRYRKELC